MQINEHKHNLEPLKCDQCDKHLCYVSALDMNGNYFFCNECTEEVIPVCPVCKGINEKPFDGIHECIHCHFIGGL